MINLIKIVKGVIKLNRILITVKEVSELLGVSLNTVYTMVRNNEIPYIKIRGKVMFNRNIIEDWTKNPQKYVLHREVN